MCSTSTQSSANNSAGVTVLAVLLCLAVAVAAWFWYKHRQIVRAFAQYQAAQEIDGGGRHMIGMMDNPLAQPSQAAAAAAAATGGGEEGGGVGGGSGAGGTRGGAEYLVPFDAGSADASYAQVYSIYDGTVGRGTSANLPMDSDNYVLDTSA